MHFRKISEKGKKSKGAHNLCLFGGPEVGQIAMLPLYSKWYPKKGDKSRSGNITHVFSGTQKRSKLLFYRCILRDPQKKGDKKGLCLASRKKALGPALDTKNIMSSRTRPSLMRVVCRWVCRCYIY